uniref:Hypoxanthine phosphoribosyltransferase n=2 Tax=Schistocephalus solidus TaxID=70667 RepID=A0A0X3NT94_SCHSO
MNRKGEPVVLDDSFAGFPLSSFCIPERYVPHLESVLVSNGMIKDRIKRIAVEIIEFFENEGITSVSIFCVLKGGFKFFSDLIDEMQQSIWSKNCNISLQIEFVRVKSYIDTKSGDVVISDKENCMSIKGKNVLVVDDLVDTGNSMLKLTEYLHVLGALSVHVTCLLLKRTQLSRGYRPDFLGFEVPDRFIVGYAIDYNECFRDLLHICSINEKAKKVFSMRNQGELGYLPPVDS